MTVYLPRGQDLKSGEVDFPLEICSKENQLHIILEADKNDDHHLKDPCSEYLDTTLSHKYTCNSNMFTSVSTPVTKEISRSYNCNSSAAPEVKPYPICLQRKIVKSNNEVPPIAKCPRLEQSGHFLSHNNIRDDIASSKQEDMLPHSNSSSSLDFLAEGERMVSELCNISTDVSVGDIPQLATSKAKVNIMCGMFNTSYKDNRPIMPSRNKAPSDFCDETIPLQIIQLAVEACTTAEHIAIANKNRPCFKNIQTICEKTKSNVQKPDSAVANLHSQGIPWVIKNFIFSFVRILDGWKGIKELMCVKHESFMRIEHKYYNPQIRECFLDWQVSTKNMLSHIYRTFKALDDGFKAEQHRFKQTCNGSSFMQNQNKLQSKISRPTNNQDGTLVGQWSMSFPHQHPPSQVSSNAYLQWTSFPQSGSNTGFSKPVLNNRVDSEVYNANSSFPTNYTAPLSGIVDTKERSDKKNCQDSKDITKLSANWYQQCTDFQLNYNNPPNLTAVNKNIINNNNLNGSSNNFSKASFLSHTIPESDNEFFNKMDPTDAGVRTMNFWVHNAPNNNGFYGCYEPAKNSSTSFFSSKTSAMFSHTPNATPIGNSIKPASLLDSDIDENDQTNVYMKPGSYDIPIKPSETTQGPEFSSVETLTVHNSLISKRDIPLMMNLPISSELIPSQQTPVTFTSQSDTVTSSEKNGISDVLFIHKVNELNSLCLDKEWEAAKQLAPKLLNTIHGKCVSKSDSQRLCDALELNRSNSAVVDYNQSSCYIVPSGNVYWNKVSQDFFGEKNTAVNEQDNLQPIQEPFHGATDNNSVSIPNSVGENATKENKITSGKISNDDQIIPEENTSNNTFDLNTEFAEKVITSGDNSVFIEKEYASCDTVKKLKKKNNYLTSKYFNKKKKYFTIGGNKKIQNILIELWNLERKQHVKFGLDLSKAPRYYEVVKDPITINDVSNKVKNSHYTDIDQVAQDFQCIFCNAYLYLKVHPDGELKLQTDNVSDYFEKLFYDEFIYLDTKPIREKSNKK